MGVALWTFLESDGELKRFPTSRWWRFYDGHERLPERASEEIRVVEVSLEVARRQVRRVLRVLPYRMPVRPEGSSDIETANQIAFGRLALGDFGIAGGEQTPADVIRQLELDASYFWALSRQQVATLARAVHSQPRDVSRAIWRQP